MTPAFVPFAIALAASGPAPAVPAPLTALHPAMTRCAPPAAAKPKPPSQALLDAFGILRRDRSDADALPAPALRMLRLRGIRVSDPNAARLLRRSAGGRAWVVPVGDVRPLLGMPIACAPPLRPALRRPRRIPQTRRVPRPRRVPPAIVRRVPPPVFGPGPAPFPAFAPQPIPRTPQEGLVVIAEGGAPAGGGGTHKQLIRGLAAPAVEPCAGPKRDLISVSGIVPDGVNAVFLTSADGTAIRTGVEHNGYAFLVPPAGGREAWAPRYVVWTGGDGTPHVQQVRLSRFPPRLCAAMARHRRDPVIQVTPNGAFDLAPAPLPARPPRAPAPRRP